MAGALSLQERLEMSGKSTNRQQADVEAWIPLRKFANLGIPLTHVLLYVVVAFPACTILAYGTGSMLTAC